MWLDFLLFCYVFAVHRWADEISSSYSGGNKRKLSVGVALIGNPPIVFLVSQRCSRLPLPISSHGQRCLIDERLA